MKKIVILAAALAMLSGSNSAIAVPRAKSGAKCSKAGLTQIVADKKFTCVKSGSKLIWNKGAAIKPIPTISPTALATPNPIETTQAPAPTQSLTPSLSKFKNCTEVKAAGAAPLTKAKSPELYELNAGLDRDKDGVACES